MSSSGERGERGNSSVLFLDGTLHFERGDTSTFGNQLSDDFLPGARRKRHAERGPVSSAKETEDSESGPNCQDVL